MRKPILTLLSLFLFWSTLGQKTIGSIERLNDEINSLIASDAVIEVLAEGFSWAEGPVWVPELNGLLFSDVPENKIYLWEKTKGLSVFLNPSGYTGYAPNNKKSGSNGLILDSKGNLLIAQHGDRRVAMIKKPLGKPSAFKTVIDRFQGKRFNSPNDLILSKRGDLYFTDPPYGLSGDEDPLKEIQNNGVYRMDTKGNITQIYSDLNRPNGLALSKDETVLYVANSHPKKNLWMAFSMEKGSIVSERIFFDATEKKGLGLADGLKVHSRGYVFATGPSGVFIFTSTGKHLGTIKTETATANCAFNSDESVLYMTSDNVLTRIQLK
tara:strand:+ start:10210 stop:11184 length:975 start_codon:yes stop_codon:yes gene_type:complete